MINFEKAFGVGNSGGVRVATPILASRDWVAPMDGIVVIRLVSGAGSGAVGTFPNYATGGYAGSWALKVLRVTKGQTIAVAIGAGGLAKSGVGNGNAGAISSVTVAGVVHSVPGGLGGVYSTTLPTLPAGPVSSDTWWDMVVAAMRPGLAAGYTGGAGLDILAQGGTATSSGNATQSGGGGSGAQSPTVGGFGGGALPNGRSLRGLLLYNGLADFVDAISGLWGLAFYGGGGGSGSGVTSQGGNGGGGGYDNPTGGGGGFGGGGGAGATTGGPGGIGAGGGAAPSSTSGPGGQGYCYMDFYADAKGV